MKAFSNTLGLLISICGVSLGEPEEKEKEKKPTYESLAGEFYEVVIAPSNLALTVKDEATLKKVVAKLKESQKEIGRLAKAFQKLPAPNAAQKKAINKVMEKRMAESEEEEGKNVGEHLEDLPDKLRNKLLVAMQGFYSELGKHEAVFEKYFGEEE